LTCGPKFRPVHGGPMATTGRRAHRRWLAGNSGLGFSPSEHLDDEGTEGILTMENGSWGGIGCSGEMGCSWAIYLGRGRLAEVAVERSQWRPVEFNGAAVSSLDSAPRGRGNEGAVPLWKGKWSWRGLRHGGGARRDSSRPDGRSWCDIELEEEDEGGAGRVGCKGRVGWMTKWASFGNGKRK
jgi:hypothetical protein